MPLARRLDQSSVAVVVALVDVGAVVKQQPDDGRVPSSGGREQSRVAVAIGSADVDVLACEQLLDDAGVALVSRTYVIVVWAACNSGVGCRYSHL